MELFFNEISAFYREDTRHAARERMQNLLELCKNAKKNGFNRLRTDRGFDFQELTKGYKVSDWYSDKAVSRTLKDFFLGFRKFPYETGDDMAEEVFITATYRLNEPDEPRWNGAVTGGLAWAYIIQTLCVSFPVNSVWKKTSISLVEEKGPVCTNISARHTSEPAHLSAHQEWIDSLKEVVLVKNDLLPTHKNIHLREDHGKDVLSVLARKLLKSSYVIGILNSLPFNPKEGSFIRRVFPNGIIEIVLPWTDEGFGMVVQTTGRNLRETEAIGRMLREDFS